MLTLCTHKSTKTDITERIKDKMFYILNGI